MKRETFLKENDKKKSDKRAKLIWREINYQEKKSDKNLIKSHGLNTEIRLKI